MQIVLRGANFAAGYSDTELAALADYVIARFGGTTA
jgi:hypothetical protein